MRRKALALVLILGMGTPGYSQFKGLLNKVRSKVDQRVDGKVNGAIDRTLDKAAGKNTGADAGVGGNAGSAVGDSVTGKGGAAAETGGVKAFSKYDFVAGERILYAEDFSQEAIGELPAGWNSNGSGEVVKLDRIEGQWLRLHKSIAYLSANQQSFGQNYTIEFDLVLQLKNNGWIYPEFMFGVLATRGKAAADNVLLKDYRQFSSVLATIYPAEYNNSRAGLVSAAEGRDYFRGEPISAAALQKCWGRPVHIAVQVQKERLRCWINELKAFDVPRAVPLTDTMNQLRFEVGSTNYTEEGYGVYIGNIRIATGLADTRHRLMEVGKFATNGILFDVQSAVIRPESYGVIKEIATVMKDNPSLRVKVIGHTSSDGDDAANMELSGKRAEAVKDLLMSEWQIEGTRIETAGKGETEPVADNKTREGRSQNRRVEFIKL